MAEEFLWMGNHPAADLCNTEPVIAGSRVELLPDFGAVVRWAAGVGIANSAGNPAVSDREAAQTLRFVRRLRMSLRDILDPTGPGDESIAGLNQLLGAERGALQVDDGSAAGMVWLRAATAAAQLRLDIAAAVLDIFCYDRRRVRCCANPVCVLLFLDRSKSGLRRWCDMATCGNRAKAAAHYARGRTTLEPRLRPHP